MEILEKRIKIKGNILHLVPYGDFHLGNVNADKDKILEIRDFVRRNHDTIWLGMGDYFDAIVPTDEARYDIETIDPELNTTDKQKKYIETLLRPIKGNCIGLLQGNHEDELRRRHFHDYMQDLAENLETKDLGWTAYIRLMVEKDGQENPFLVYATHGAYNGDKMGGAINKLTDISSQWDADVYLMGHTHWAHGWRFVTKVLSKNGELNMSERKKAFALTGGFLRAYQLGNASYLEKKAKLERKIGIVRVTIDPVRADIHVTE